MHAAKVHAWCGPCAECSPPPPPSPTPTPTPTLPPGTAYATYTFGLAVASEDGTCEGLFPSPTALTNFVTSQRTELAKSLSIALADVFIPSINCTTSAGSSNTIMLSKAQGGHRRSRSLAQAGELLDLEIPMQLLSAQAVSQVAAVLSGGNAPNFTAVFEAVVQASLPTATIASVGTFQLAANPPPMPMPPPPPVPVTVWATSAASPR